ncbi:potassium transporter TrkA [Kineobactrum sediminis]|uniref:Potassium transporter TrkA n=1 Tax=Kineobactrum sediminis TaxID=1905677 RepID=A0A2N5Y7F6_9GAMM|nr:potassium channel protein [Kineobactrum sediminis]PLW84328.1 potassium transporter TrkA [Kineobactrum sediminis]
MATRSPLNDSFIFLFLRRMRVPLVVLISAYAIATVGFTLMPGTDDQGNPWHMSLFEAFYVVSYTGSTIGFGEVPYDFSAAQRLWTIVSIYLTVIAWLFSIGSIISLLQDPAYTRALRRARLSRRVRGMNQPFYLVCGYGDTGRMLTRALTSRGHQVVVIDTHQEKIEMLEIENLHAPVIPFFMNANWPDNLEQAGLRNRWCSGVIAVTGNGQVNLKIAISATLLNRKVAVYARANTHSEADNMRSFATDHVVNPVEEYVRRLELAIDKPDLFRLYHWLNSGPDAHLMKQLPMPRGNWIVCGFNRVGRAAWQLLRERGMEVSVIDPDPNGEGRPEGTIRGCGTQADELTAAGVYSAVGIVAASDDDADNLSILITARALNPDLFHVVLENGLSSHSLFRAAEPEIIGQPSVVIAGTILSRISSRLVEPFILNLLARDNAFARDVLACFLRHQDHRPPEFSSGRISAKRAPALTRAIESGRTVTVGALLTNPRQRGLRLPLEVALIRRKQEDILFPADDTVLALGDRLLLAGRDGAAKAVRSVLESDALLEYVLTGKDRQQGPLWQWLERRLG